MIHALWEELQVMHEFFIRLALPPLPSYPLVLKYASEGDLRPAGGSCRSRAVICHALYSAFTPPPLLYPLVLKYVAEVIHASVGGSCGKA